MKIHKYPLSDMPGHYSWHMPNGSKILSFGVDARGDLCVWASVPEEGDLQPFAVLLRWTGGDAPSDPSAPFLGTVVHDGFVLHAWQVR